MQMGNKSKWRIIGRIYQKMKIMLKKGRDQRTMENNGEASKAFFKNMLAFPYAIAKVRIFL